MNIAGWKDVLRPIRDGFRHVFPSPDTGPTPDERRKQRRLDALKGFTYFDTFDQLEEWIQDSTDPIQRANTPLLLRPSLSEKDMQTSANILLCHDYSGNYHDYEAVQGVGVDDELYSCEYLQFIDTFIYFSHKLVCVPPPSWTNTLHRNGVKALGTLLIEPGTEDAKRMLECSGNADAEGDIYFPMARKLSTIAKHYGFEGWLVNIEKSFPKQDWSLHLLLAFLKQLRHELGHNGQVIWYDALTIHNKIEYQNSLTAQNFPFTQTSGTILTNYCWKEDNISKTKEFAQQNHIPTQAIYFGVDVWAQNSKKFSHPRVTYGGGGTNTGKAVAKLAHEQISVGIFAPAWSYEHFPKQGRAIDRHMWDGTELPEELDCACGKNSKRHPPNELLPITRFARAYPAGSENFFYTDFGRAFSGHDAALVKIYNGRLRHSQLGAQSILPHFGPRRVINDEVEDALNVLFGELIESPPRLTVFAESLMPVPPSSSEVYVRSLRFFKFDMPADGSLELVLTFQYQLFLAGAYASFYLKFSDGLRLIPIRGDGDEIQTLRIPILRQGDSTEPSTDRLREIGIYMTAPPVEQDQKTSIMVVMEICIAPVPLVYQPCEIIDLRMESRGEADTAHWRLCWTIGGVTSEQERRLDVPYSELTGPFAYFLIEIRGLSIGRAYALEFVLSQGLVDIFDSGMGVDVEVTGVGFDGRHLAVCTQRLDLSSGLS